jgi:hypothetical protein
MFKRIVPPFYTPDLLGAAPAKPATTSIVVPIASTVAESQSLLLIGLLSILLV